MCRHVYYDNVTCFVDVYVYCIGMYIAQVPNRSSPPAFLLRESYRVGKKVKSRTLANVTHFPAEQIAVMRRALAGETLVAPTDLFQIERSLPHGHVFAVLGTLRRLGLDRIIAVKESRERSLVLAMIVARIINPRSKLATARGLGNETAFSSLGETLGVESADADELYEAMDWLLERQTKMERKLAAQSRRAGKRRIAGALRRELDVLRGTHVSVGQVRP